MKQPEEKMKPPVNSNTAIRALNKLINTTVNATLVEHGLGKGTPRKAHADERKAAQLILMLLLHRKPTLAEMSQLEV
jgi:hypothetical protein